MGRYNRVSPEDPNIWIFDVRLRMHMPGGLLNTAVQFRSMNKHLLTYVHAILTPTQVKLMRNYHLLLERQSKIVSQNDSVMKERVVDEATKTVMARMDSRPLFKRYHSAIFRQKMHRTSRDYLAVLVSDYQKGTITDEVIDYLTRFKVPFFVDTKNPDLSVWQKLSNCYVKINQSEYEKAYNFDCVEHLIVTSGENGAYYYHNGHCEHFPTWPMTERHYTIGAGDSFLAAFATRMLECNNDVADSIRYANIAARSVMRGVGHKVLMTRGLVDKEIERVQQLVA